MCCLLQISMTTNFSISVLDSLESLPRSSCIIMYNLLLRFYFSISMFGFLQMMFSISLHIFTTEISGAIVLYIYIYTILYLYIYVIKKCYILHCRISHLHSIRLMWQCPSVFDFFFFLKKFISFLTIAHPKDDVIVTHYEVARMRELVNRYLHMRMWIAILVYADAVIYINKFTNHTW